MILLIAATMYLLVLHCLLLSVTYDRDENMYMAASYFVVHGLMPYRDFLYFQTPYLPFLYAGIYSVIDGGGYYVIGKICTLFFYLAALFTCARYGYFKTKNINFSFALIVLFLVNPVMNRIGLVVSNYMLASLFSLLSFYVYVKGLSSRKRVFFFMAGLCVGLSAGIKLYHVTLIAPYFLCSLFFLNPIREKLKIEIIPLLTGFFIAVFPIFIFFGFYPDEFIYNNLGYHFASQNVFAARMDWHRRLEGILAVFIRAETFVVALLVFAGFGFLRKSRVFDREGVVLLAVFVTALLSAITPSPSHEEYFSYPLVFLFAGLAYIYSRMDLSGLLGATLPVAALLLVGKLAYSEPDIFFHPGGLLSYRSAVFIYAEEMNSLKEKYNLEDGVATFTPLTGIQSEVPILTDFSGGIFNQITRLYLPLEERKKYGIGDEALFESLKRKRPALIQLGLEPEDATLVQYANEMKYVPLSKHFYLRPDLY